jgi:thiol-disulfide isomerase/thioredoxin
MALNAARRFRFPMLILFSLLLVLTACGEDDANLIGSGDSTGGPEHDFAFIPYQGIGNPGDEEEMMFSDLFAEGKPVVLNFWAGQCPPCRAEMPHFQQLADEYGDEFILIGIDVGVFTGLGTEQNALDLLDELDITYPAGRALERDPLIDYGATGMPTTVFMSAEGEIVEKRIGLILEDEMREKLDALL